MELLVKGSGFNAQLDKLANDVDVSTLKQLISQSHTKAPAAEAQRLVGLFLCIKFADALM